MDSPSLGNDQTNTGVRQDTDFELVNPALELESSALSLGDFIQIIGYTLVYGGGLLVPSVFVIINAVLLGSSNSSLRQSFGLGSIVLSVLVSIPLGIFYFSTMLDYKFTVLIGGMSLFLYVMVGVLGLLNVVLRPPIVTQKDNLEFSSPLARVGTSWGIWTEFFISILIF